ncbi:MAG: di-trans,poly-cis-decaprenylcistransferase [Thermoplasmata archaeon]|jgi:tritrans,polycis-undecaprenyl-diphosphate synthase [geranylgeranyl-diphosphate specific]|nr:di-trans,poly-cis-decaprenylcistransferase [Thermoplasmata archaeon]
MELPRIVSDKAYSVYEAELEKQVREGDMPKHLAIIMDGNRRYAREVLNTDPIEGHKLGRDKLNEVVHWCLDLGIHHLTVYAFSTENFDRDPEEVSCIMDLLEKSLYEFGDDEEVHKWHVGIKVIGDQSLLPDNVLEAMRYAEEKTKGYSDFSLNMAIAYGGRQDITNAVRTIAEKVKSGEIDVEDINESMISSCISTGDLPDPDLILRTSGEIRVSNFLLWQMAYSELYFTDIYWPGFRFIDMLRAVRTYQQRKRRFGK